MDTKSAARIERAIIIAGALIALAVYMGSGDGRYQHRGQGLVLDTRTGVSCRALSDDCAEFGELSKSADR